MVYCNIYINKMNGFTNIYFVIFGSLLSTVYLTYTQAEENVPTNDLGKSACRWWGTLDIACQVTALKADQIPKDCTSLLYEGLKINSENIAEDTLGGTVLDDLLATGKNVMMYIGYVDTNAWITALNVDNDQANKNAETVIKGVNMFLEEHKGVKGLIFINLGDAGLRKCTENLMTYVCKIKEKFPGIAVGMSISTSESIFKVGDLKSNWLDFGNYPNLFDFFILSLIDINSCTKEYVQTGVFPLTGDCSIDTYKNHLVSAGITTNKIYYDIQNSGTLKTASESLCNNLYYYICSQKIKADNENLCADTLTSFYDKGKYVKDNGNGFIVTIDIDDFAGSCQCGGNFPIFNAILNGFNGQQKPLPCPLLDRC